MTKPTEKQIADEIKALRELRDKIPPRTSFGDSNLDRIDAEIDVLSTNMSSKMIELKYGDDETAEEYSGQSGAYESADYARQWLDGDALDGSMSDNWRSLVGVKPKKL